MNQHYLITDYTIQIGVLNPLGILILKQRGLKIYLFVHLYSLSCMCIVLTLTVIFMHWNMVEPSAFLSELELVFSSVHKDLVTIQMFPYTLFYFMCTLYCSSLLPIKSVGFFRNPKEVFGKVEKAFIKLP